MAGMTFNQFQVQLRKLGIEGPMANILTTMYEQMRENAEQLDMCAGLIQQLVLTVNNLVGLNEALEGKMSALKQRMGDDEQFASVPFTEESNN